MSPKPVAEVLACASETFASNLILLNFTMFSLRFAPFCISYFTFLISFSAPIDFPSTQLTGARFGVACAAFSAANAFVVGVGNALDGVLRVWSLSVAAPGSSSGSGSGSEGPVKCIAEARLTGKCSHISSKTASKNWNVSL
jgi:hypothetical protein